MKRPSFTDCPAAYQFAARTDTSAVDSACALHRFDRAADRRPRSLLAYAVALVAVCGAVVLIFA